MKINLDELELKTAITEYIANQGLDITNKAVEIELIAGRGTNGHRAEVEILPTGSLEEVASEAQSPASEPAVPDFDFGDDQTED